MITNNYIESRLSHIEDHLDDIHDLLIKRLPEETEHDAGVAAKALRETAREWRTEEPQRSTYAHAQFFARELDLRADRIEAT